MEKKIFAGAEQDGTDGCIAAIFCRNAVVPGPIFYRFKLETLFHLIIPIASTKQYQKYNTILTTEIIISTAQNFENIDCIH